MTTIPDLPAAKRAYSYVRFSRAHQADGDSMRRQEAATQKYCDKRGFILDKSLDLEDKGVSAWRGKNAKQGALGRFLDACERGVVPPGSALIVENLDRLSRDKPRRTQRLLSELLDDYKIEIHLTMIDKVLLPEKDDGMDAMYVVALAARANEESETKSGRLIEAFAEKRKEAAEGKAVIIHPVCPWWLILDKENSKFICPPERAAVVKLIYEMASGGWSTPQIARHLRECGQPTWRTETRKKLSTGEANPKLGQQRTWDSVYIRKILSSDAAQGHVSPMGRLGRKHTVTNYYPRIVTDELAAEARAAQARLAKRSKGRIADGKRPTNLFRNLLRFKGHWVRHGAAPNRKLDAHGQKTYIGYYECIEPDAGKLLYYSPARQLEPVILACLSELHPEDLRPLDGATRPLRSIILKAQLANIETKAANLLAAIESGSLAVANRLKQLEGELAMGRRELAEAIREETIPADDANKGELDQIRSLTPNLKSNEDRERIAAALRRILTSIDVGRDMSDLPLSIKERGRFMRKIMSEAPETISDVSPTDRARKPIYLFVAFVGGSRRLIVRDDSILPKNLIASIRVEPPTEIEVNRQQEPLSVGENSTDKGS
ncbi:MAG TPA: recombinase family protein [Terrimicrobiaceae bacterium]|nr:recombinase family protein [Terrimicrobiaceae bacterium]